MSTIVAYIFFFSSRRRHTRWTGDWSSDVCSSDLGWSAAAWTPTSMACNPFGIVHGGVYGVVLDAAMNFALNAALERGRSEERRVGKECRSRWGHDDVKKK